MKAKIKEFIRWSIGKLFRPIIARVEVWRRRCEFKAKDGTINRVESFILPFATRVLEKTRHSDWNGIIQTKPEDQEAMIRLGGLVPRDRRIQPSRKRTINLGTLPRIP
jgi:hypothetical protein